MRNFSYEESNNNKHNYRLVNMSQGINLIPFLVPDSLNYSKSQRTVDDKISPNTVSFRLKFPYSTTEITAIADEYMYIDSDLLTGCYTDDVTPSLEYVKYAGKISLKKLFQETHEYLLLEEYNGDFPIFTGYSEEIEWDRQSNFIYIDITLKDKTTALYSKKYTKNYQFTDMYLSNNSIKSNSMLHQLGYLLGFKDEELDIEDIKDVNGYIVIPFVYFTKDEKIITDLAEAVRLVNLVFTHENNKLTIKSAPIGDSYVFDKRNILGSIKKKLILPEYKKMKITYDKFFKKTKQIMWYLSGESGTENSANILVRAGNTRKFAVTWFYEVDYIDDYEVYDVKFADVNGNSITPAYTLDVSGLGGTLTIAATTTDIYVKSFKIKGIPLWCQGDNTGYYPSNVSTEDMKDDSTNKYVQTDSLAMLYLKIYYQKYCLAYNEFNFSTNVANFLVPGSKIWLSHEDFEGYIIVNSISYGSNKMNIKAVEYLDEFSVNNFDFVEKSTVDEAATSSKNLLTDLNLYDSDTPAVPTNLVLTTMALGFTISVDLPASTVKGHFIYWKHESDTDFQKFFVGSNNYFFQTTSSVIFNIKVSNLSINGFEGPCTDVKNVKALLVKSTYVEYPEGLSPNELDTKVQIINQNIEDINNEVAAKTTENQVETITNTAIEKFSNTEFRRTLGTRVSIVDYEKNIDDVQTIDIDSDELKEVIIEDYYSSIYQNSRQILSVVKNAEDQYSAIQQLVNQITLLVQEDSKNYSMIEQLTDELTLVVKKDNLISSINQTAEEIQINAARIALGNGLVVEGDQVAVRDLGAEHIRAGAITGDKLKIGDNFEVGTEGELQVKKIAAESINTGTINGVDGNPIVLGNDTEIKGNVELDEGNTISLTNSVNIGKNVRGVGKDGILIENGGLEVRNAQGTTIFDGTSNVLKIHQTGVISCPNGSNVTVPFASLGYPPAFMIFRTTTDGFAEESFYNYYISSLDSRFYREGLKGWSKDGALHINFHKWSTNNGGGDMRAMTPTAVNVRYYIFKEVGI